MQDLANICEKHHVDINSCSFWVDGEVHVDVVDHFAKWHLDDIGDPKAATPVMKFVDSTTQRGDHKCWYDERRRIGSLVSQGNKIWTVTPK